MIEWGSPNYRIFCSSKPLSKNPYTRETIRVTWNLKLLPNRVSKAEYNDKQTKIKWQFSIDIALNKMNSKYQSVNQANEKYVKT